MANSDNLHLPDLKIKGFRGIEELSIRKLGRVTLLAGKNSVGKTTVLDAVRAYAARGRYSILTDLLEEREEFSAAADEEGDSLAWPDLAALFYSRNITKNACVSIGPINGTSTLKISSASLASLSDEQVSILERFSYDISLDENLQALKVVFQEKEQIIPRVISHSTRVRFPTSLLRRNISRLSNENEMPAVTECVSLGPGLLSNYDIARFWDEVVLTDDETQAVHALRLIFGVAVDRVAMVSDDRPRYRRGSRRVVVKLASHDRPVPLRSLGDGASRLFSVALALANSRDGFLLIDEAENGIHHSVQVDYWRMVLQTAQRNNVQVLATTHSWDCVRGFAQAATESEEVEGVLVRLEKDEDGLYTVEYSEERLQTAAEHDIEVR